MKAIIPDHSIAILTGSRVNITDPRVQKPADDIATKPNYIFLIGFYVGILFDQFTAFETNFLMLRASFTAIRMRCFFAT